MTAAAMPKAGARLTPVRRATGARDSPRGITSSARRCRCRTVTDRPPITTRQAAGITQRGAAGRSGDSESGFRAVPGKRHGVLLIMTAPQSLPRNEPGAAAG